ncbi:CDP-diacylglycerol--glycerol-3-phosphate 3-phosphatidyltransferase [Rhizoclosmatium sp. JEL0117]|nr:CDP-diacylglycerol--glycerol-3-phosphate 3-phosphatidyltransferase [Rhizoclosmatium sp. JEL0117]
MEAKARDIHILETPTEFYGALLDGIRRARTRIALGSLYIGHKEGELRESLDSALASNPSLNVHVLVDQMRGTRPDKNARSSSTATLLLPLVKKYPTQTTVSLFEFPSKNPLTKLVPARFNEAFGLQHIKAYVFDNDVVISGANLNTDYFTNRQDRYILIKNNPQVAAYFTSLLETIGQQSNTLTSDPANPILKRNASLSEMKAALTKFSNKSLAEMPSNALTDAVSISPLESANCDTTITPFLQAGPLGINTEAHLLTLLLKNVAASSETTVVCSSAYFNLPKHFHNLVLQSKARFQFLLAAPEANGFFGSKGVSRHIPFAYTFLTNNFWQEVIKTHNTDRIEIQEYKRDGCTYHAKGIWISEKGKNPHMTIIGSSNYGYRSFSRDLEAQVVIRTNNPDLQRRLGENLLRMQGYATRVDEKNFLSAERKPGLFVRIAARIIKTML